MNFKLRLKNKTTLMAICLMVITIAYTVCSMLGIAPSVSAEQWKELVALVVQLLVLLGIVVDPTTEGIKDSELAMGYNEPKKDNE